MKSAPVKFEQEWLWQKMPSTRERTFNKNLKYQLESADDKDIMWSVLLYGSETWTLGKKTLKDWKHVKCGFGEEF